MEYVLIENRVGKNKTANNHLGLLALVKAFVRPFITCVRVRQKEQPFNNEHLKLLLS